MAVPFQDVLTLPAFVTPLAVILFTPVLIYLVERCLFEVPYPRGIPLIREGEDVRRFSWRTRLSFYIDCQAIHREAYEKYATKGRPVVIPGFGFRKEVIMPVNSLQWVSRQPENRLSLVEALAEMSAAGWIFGNKRIVDTVQALILKTMLNRVLGDISGALYDELQIAIDAQFGFDTTNWKTIDLVPAMREIVAQASSRIMVGLPLCRNKSYIRTVLAINKLFLISGAITIATPRWLQPVVGTLLSWPMSRYLKQMNKWFTPLWNERLQSVQYGCDKIDHKEPQDYVQMMSRFVAAQRPEELQDQGLMLRRLTIQLFSSTFQPGTQAANLLLDIIGSDAEYNTIEALREEAHHVLGSQPIDQVSWSKAILRQMVKADSAAKETLRLHSFGSRTVMRKVLADGFCTEDGYAIPKGTVISFLTQPALIGSATSKDPRHYDPFRFSQVDRTTSGRQLDTDKNEAPVDLVTPSHAFITFGHGKHACPGRFLVDFELKMIMAYVLCNYDIKFPASYEGKRPPNYLIPEVDLPPSGARICVRRRER